MRKIIAALDTPDARGLTLEEVNCYQLHTNHKYHDAGEAWARPVNQR